MISDDARICEALTNWFESQDIEPSKACSCMAQLLGVMIGGIALNISDVIKGAVLAHESTVNTALASYAEKIKGG